MTNRVDITSLEEILRKHLGDAAARIMDSVVSKALDEDWVGMTYGEWKKTHDDEHHAVWMADMKYGFAGNTVWGDVDDCRIVKVVSGGVDEIKVLHLWNDEWGDWKKARTRYMICWDDGGRVVESWDRDDYKTINRDALKAHNGSYRIYRFDGVAPCGDEMWVLDKRVVVKGKKEG